MRAVVFDVGETLVDESREWLAWADALGVPPLTLLGALGGLAARGEDHRRAFALVAPDADLAAAEAVVEAAGFAGYDARDLYPDAVPCLQALRAAGLALGVAANQPARTEAFVRALPVPLDLVATSASWGVAKPAPAFFARVADALRLPPSEVAYVGDRVDLDVVPAAAAGMVAVHVRRGPWGLLQRAWPEAARAALRVDTLAELPAALAALPAAGPRPGSA